MILLERIYYFTNNLDIEKVFDEYLQSALHGYKFTFMDHIYEKDKIYYKYNGAKIRFNEIKFDLI